METSAAAACVSRVAPSSSCLFSPFSDQSHVEFYRCSTSPSLSLRSSSSRSSLLAPSIPPLRALCYSAVAPPVLEPPQEPSLLLKELADLKLQMKQKKKELKAHKREEKKRSKMQLKEEKKVTMNGLTEGKKKKMKKCSSESSSSSESSDEGCESMSMSVLRKERSLLECTQPGVVQNGFVEGDTGVSAKIQVTDSMPMSCRSSCSGAMAFVSEISPLSESRVMNEGEGDAYEKDILNKRLLRLSQSLAPVFPSVQCANKIEVCAGGKCKKAGSEQLLSAFRAQIPASSNVEAVPCKCMGKCSAAMNVKIHKEDTNPQHHSQVRVEDANLILNHHFGLGRAPSGLPAIPSDDKARTPSPLSAPMVCGV